MKKIYVGVLLGLMLAQPVFGMEEGCNSEGTNTKAIIIVRSPQEQKALNEEFFRAVMRCDIPAVEQCIKQGGVVNARFSNGWTALHVACIHDKLPLVKKLALYIDVNARDGCGLTSLHWACFRNNNPVIKALLTCKNIKVNVADSWGETPLLKACILDNSEAVKLFLKSCVKPEEVNWKQVRLIWIGFMKEEQAYCNLAKLSTEMIYYILGFCDDIRRDNRKKNIESLKSLICHLTSYTWTAFSWMSNNVKNEFGHILDPQAWKDDEAAQKTYAQLLMLLQKDGAKKRKRVQELELETKKVKKEQPEENGKEEQE